jgi:hypothetical protein
MANIQTEDVSASQWERDGEQETVAVEAARITQQQERAAGERFADVLRLLGAVGALHPEGSPLHCFGLNVVDYASLAVVSSGCRDAVAANDCWNIALAALEHDCPFVPSRTLQGERENRDVPYDEYADWSYLPKYLWRQELGDPRYDAAGWAVAPPIRRFSDLLGFAQRTVEVLRKFPAAVNSEEWFSDCYGATAGTNPPA